MSHLMSAYAPQNVTFERGEGVWLWDTEGKKYLDALAGIAVVSLGHSHPKVTAAISEQAGKLMQVSNGFHIKEQIKLADTLAKLTGLDKAFFCSTGAEANEAAIKITRLHANRNGIKNPVVITMEKSFHGRTMATVSATGNVKVKADLDPLLPGFVHCPYNDLPALEKLMSEHKANLVGVMLEPIQGEGGINVPAIGYLKGIRQLCDKHEVFMILDEIQTGVGRTGKMFAYQHEGILPDILTTAKALGNGYPVAACIAKGIAADVIKLGNHGTTFGGSPIASRAAQTVLDVMLDENVPQHAADMGAYLVAELKNKLKDFDCVTGVRGKGLMIGIELDRQCTELRGIGLEAGLVFNVTQGNVIRLVPPLVINKEETDLLINGLQQLIKGFVS